MSENTSKGWIIYNVTCEKVFSGSSWDRTTILSKSHIHSNEELQKLRMRGKENWMVTPVYIREAVWSDGEGVIIKGQLERFWLEEKQEN